MRLRLKRYTIQLTLIIYRSGLPKDSCVITFKDLIDVLEFNN